MNQCECCSCLRDSFNVRSLTNQHLLAFVWCLPLNYLNCCWKRWYNKDIPFRIQIYERFHAFSYYSNIMPISVICASHDSASRTVIGHFQSIIPYVSISLHNVVKYCKIWFHVEIKHKSNQPWMGGGGILNFWCVVKIRVWLGLAILEATWEAVRTVLLRLLEERALAWTWRIHCLDVQITPFSVSASFGNLLSVSCWHNWWF